MYKIKTYSSLFATKMNYILDTVNVVPLQYGRTKAIEQLVGEKSSTINNWLFNAKIPQSSKQLAIADSIGVSFNYLFDDSIDIENISKPEAYYDGQVYLLPFIDEAELFNFKQKVIYPIQKRFPIIFPNFGDLVEKYGNNIYFTKLTNTNMEPYIQVGSDLIYSENIILENFKLLIHKNAQQELLVKRINESGKALFLESFSKNGQFKKEIINHHNFNNNDFLFIVLAYQKFLSP